jgi:hypothetical protein
MYQDMCIYDKLKPGDFIPSLAKDRGRIDVPPPPMSYTSRVRQRKLPIP